MGWNLADIFILVVILVSAGFGMARGFVRETVALAIWLAAFLSATMFAESTMDIVQFEWMDGLSEQAQQAAFWPIDFPLKKKIKFYF